MAEKKSALPPLEVHPLIRLIRWACLLCGVIYGFGKRRKYAAIEKVLREKEEAERPEREARLAREKFRRDSAELKELEEMFLGKSTVEEETTLNEDANKESNEELNKQLNEELNVDLDEELNVDLDEELNVDLDEELNVDLDEELKDESNVDFYEDE